MLFLDELPEFRRDVIETLRQPLEGKKVLISRGNLKVSFPADFILVAAMNPCPCGKHGQDDLSCRCSPASISRYMSKLSQAFLDRIDITVSVKALAVSQLSQTSIVGEEDELQYQRVQNARQTQLSRSEQLNSHLEQKELRAFCKLNQASEKFLENAATNLGLSARGYMRTLRLARTIADLEEAKVVELPHIAEAIRYRAESIHLHQ